MSHEIRTPLNAILGYAQLMQRDLLLSAEQRDSLKGINAGGQHLLGLINEILDSLQNRGRPDGAESGGFQPQRASARA